MRAFIVEAKSFESAQALFYALSDFQADLNGSDENGYRVTVELGTNDHRVLAVLDAVQEFTTARHVRQKAPPAGGMLTPIGGGWERKLNLAHPFGVHASRG
jgi:hypothetical protein